MNIVYGGSFNPPTNAHYEIVEKLLNTFPNSKVIVLPVGNTYGKKDLIDFNHRYTMLKILFNDNEKVIISNLEGVKEFDGTLSSLKELSKDYNDLYYVIGSDNINNLDKWINYKELLTNHSFIIIQRNNDDIDNLMKKYQHLNPSYKRFEFNHEANSTSIRNDIKNNKHWLNQEVYNYIVKNKLYGGKTDV